MVKILNFYIEKFKKLNRSVTPQGIAPHEPVLLLAVISAIAEGAIVENAFPKQLLKPFFDKIWQALVTNHKYNFDLPFTALQSEGFWHRNKSKNKLGFVFLDDELYDYLQIKKGRNILIRTLLESYFWDTKTHWQKIYPVLFEAKTADSQVYKEKNCMVNSIKTMVDADMLEVSILPISSQCLNALKEANVNSVADFCVFDLNVLIGAQRVGKRKIRILYDLQQEQRKIHGISKSLPPLVFVNKASDSKILKSANKTFCYPQTHLYFMSVPMREAMPPLDEKKTIADLALPDTLRKLFHGLGFYDFDGIYSVGATCIEYFWRYLGNENLQLLIQHFKKCGLWSAKKYQITNQCVMEDKWKPLFIARGLFHDEEFSLLRQMDIVSWSDYDSYITAYHDVTPGFLAICKIHFTNASKIKHFQKLLNDLCGTSFVDMFSSSWDSKSRNIFILRDLENKTLNEVSTIAELTRERVRQITRKMEDDIVVSLPFILPLDQCAALYLYMEGLFDLFRGVMQQGDLFDHIINDIGFAAEDQRLILLFCKLNFNATIENGNIRFPKNGCLVCKRLCDKFVNAFTSETSLSFESQCQIAQSECKECLLGKRCIENMGTFLPEFYKNNLSKKVFFNPQDKTLFSGKEYLMHRGTRREIIQNILSPNKKLSFMEIYNELLKYRSDLGERQVYGYIQSPDVVLVDRGVYMLASALPSIPIDLLNAIVNSINQKLSANSNILLSLTVIMKKYHSELSSLGCTTPYMLFEILKRAETAGIRYIKCPYVTSEKNTEKFSISGLLEDYIAENGRTALGKVRKDICSSAGVNEHVFTIAYRNSEKLLVDDDDYLLSIDDLDISREILSPVITRLEQIGETAAITAKQLFDENKVLCVKLNILGPKLLFNVLRLLESGSFIFRYPQISKSRENIVNIREQIIEFIRSTDSYCTTGEINGFSSKNHLAGRYGYFRRTDYPELFSYLPGAWVHRETMGYADDWVNIVADIAREVLDESTAPLKSYANLQEICDREDDLPRLKNDLWWTPTLVAEFLEETGDFLVYGKNKQFFSLKNTKLKLNNFGDLCALLLEKDFGGAANLHEFSNYLRTKDLISNTDLHESLLQGSNRIIIDHHEVYVSEEAVLC